MKDNFRKNKRAKRRAAAKSIMKTLNKCLKDFTKISKLFILNISQLEVILVQAISNITKESQNLLKEVRMESLYIVQNYV